MPGGPVIGLIGKLPAHGDFVRRGGPVALLARIDRWLDTELSRGRGAGCGALDGWRFVVAGAEGPVLGMMVASGDAVGRAFPLVGLVAIDDAISFAEAERWCAAAGDVLADARDAATPVDGALAALAAVPAPRPEGDATRAGWWRAGDTVPSGEAALPAGAGFDRLLGISA